MRTIVKSQELGSANIKNTNIQEPEKLSKIGVWRRENPGGWVTVIDRRAVNK